MVAPTQQPETQAPAETPAGSPAAADPAEMHLARLHKMSTTAGLGSTDYVAVNNPAVIALILGLASAAVLIDPIFFVIPVAGLICSIIAIKQIRQSNKTQTGMGLAALALLLTFGFSAFVGYRALSAELANRRLASAIGSTLTTFGKDLSDGNYAAAYQVMGPKFKEKVKEEDFAKFFTGLESNPYYGHLKEIDWNGQLASEYDPATNTHWARALTRMNYTKSGQAVSRNQFVLKEVDGEWKIEQISSYFGAESYN